MEVNPKVKQCGRSVCTEVALVFFLWFSLFGALVSDQCRRSCYALSDGTNGRYISHIHHIWNNAQHVYTKYMDISPAAIICILYVVMAFLCFAENRIKWADSFDSFRRYAGGCVLGKSPHSASWKQPTWQSYLCVFAYSNELNTEDSPPISCRSWRPSGGGGGWKTVLSRLLVTLVKTACTCIWRVFSCHQAYLVLFLLTKTEVTNSGQPPPRWQPAVKCWSLFWARGYLWEPYIKNLRLLRTSTATVVNTTGWFDPCFDRGIYHFLAEAFSDWRRSLAQNHRHFIHIIWSYVAILFCNFILKPWGCHRVALLLPSNTLTVTVLFSGDV